MEFKFIGTGGAFNPEAGNSAALVTVGGECVLLDCGSIVFGALFQKGKIESVDAVLLTHFHDDHCGSLGTFAFYYNKISPGRKLKVYYPSEKFLVEIQNFLRAVHCNPDKYFDFVSLDSQPAIDFIDTRGKHGAEIQSHSYIFSEDGTTIVYSGDNGDCGFLFEELTRKGIQPQVVFHEVTFQSGLNSHTYYKDLEKWSDAFPVIGYHCDAREAPADNKIRLVINHPEYLL